MTQVLGKFWEVLESLVLTTRIALACWVVQDRECRGVEGTVRNIRVFRDCSVFNRMQGCKQCIVEIMVYTFVLYGSIVGLVVYTGVQGSSRCLVVQDSLVCIIECRNMQESIVKYLVYGGPSSPIFLQLWCIENLQMNLP